MAAYKLKSGVRVVLIRHGESEANKLMHDDGDNVNYTKVDGHQDPELTEKG